MQDVLIGKLRQKQHARRLVFAATLLLFCIPMLTASLQAAFGAGDWVVWPLVAVVVVSWAWGGYHFFRTPCPSCQQTFAKAGFVGVSAWSELMSRTQCQHCQASWHPEQQTAVESKLS